MSSHIFLERYLWFENRVKRGAYPNAVHLVKQFEISNRTAARHIEYMRDRLHAPLEYVPRRKGYRYTDDSFELPRIPATQEELLSVLLARHLLSRSAGGYLAERIRAFGDKLMADCAGFGLDESRLLDSFSAVWHGYSPALGEVFQSACRALLDHRVLDIAYRSPASNEETRRSVEPHHLKHYMGSWMMVAWCRLRGGWRSFVLSRISDVAVTGEEFLPRPLTEWEDLVNDAFGAFQGKKRVTVVLRFTPFRSRWIREQIWHERQVIEELPDGGLCLSFPVADYREVKMTILSFGPDVEVLEPLELRRLVAGDIEAMRRVYPDGGDQGKISDVHEKNPDLRHGMT